MAATYPAACGATRGVSARRPPGSPGPCPPSPRPSRCPRSSTGRWRSSTPTDARRRDLLERFEDDDEPLAATSAEIAEQRIAEAVGALDPQEEDPAVQLAGAVATYLAFRRDEVEEEPHELMRLAARAEYDGHPPEPVRELLADRGVEL